MFFFFFGGVRPEVSKVIEASVVACPRCGSDASLVEYDNVFRAFFFPIWRWAGANPAIRCDSCSFLLSLEEFQQLRTRTERLPVSPPTATQREHMAARQPTDFRPSAPSLRCWSCSSILQPEFFFCPRCGASLQ